MDVFRARAGGHPAHAAGKLDLAVASGLVVAIGQDGVRGILADAFGSAAAMTTVEALMLSLRSRGVQALGEPNTMRRMFELDDTQLREVAIRLQKLKPEIALAWAPDDIEVLIAARRHLK